MNCKMEMQENSPRDYLRFFCFVIAALELVHSLTYAFNSIYELSLHQNATNVIAYLSAVVYVLTVKSLIVGLWKRIPKLFIFWLIFAGLATATSIVIFIWNILASPIFDMEHSAQWCIVYLGILYECFCLVLVFTYYNKLCPYSVLEGCNYDCPEEDLERNKVVCTEDKDEKYVQKSKGKYFEADTMEEIRRTPF